MFKRLTYKEFSIALGVVVVLIILVTLWLNPISGQSLNTSTSPLPKVTPQATKVLTEKLLYTVQESWR
ncbi:MAG: hypothetical protein ACK4RF_06540 [Cyclobacteriaceae bacterium]